MEKPLTQPKILYQYRPPEGWAFENLCRRVLYFNSLENFNDPYDSRFPPSLYGMTHKQRLVMEAGTAEMFREQGIGWAPNPDMSDGEYVLRGEQALREHYAEMRKSHGFACFSATNDNLLMWSHYAGHGKGFCLAFYAQDKPLFGDGAAVPIQYRSNLPDASDTVKFYEKRKPGAPLSTVLAHKPKEWEYEQEWRLMRNKQGEYDYNPQTLRAVYFGTETTESTKEIIRTIVKEKYKSAKLRQGYPSKRRYKVLFKHCPK